MEIFCKFHTVNISKLNICLLLYNTKNFIWTTLKISFLLLKFSFLAPSDSSVIPFCPILTNHTSIGHIIYSAFR